ncbi:ubiquitin carboxyl-terminal hydrolase 15 [Nicotiana tomentosiformis]|nr:ubiquitin carboxyl-terminal hydrolase 15 [Nicotiana tomentosiformis]XP_033513966.1 ubiquitin carboxyl-terminal hydrolase 15 [Nicotiana tomentosiformis]
MLQPRETDIPALFLVLVVLPLVSYILLGKWNEAAKKKERVGLLAQRAAEEAFKSETVPAVSIIPTPLVPLPSSAIHQCARCHSPATTRCSQCKSVRYCSGKCQILHWRQVHKLECHQLGNNCNSSFSQSALTDEFPGRVSFDSYVEAQYSDGNINQSWLGKAPPDGVSETSIITPLTPTAVSMVMDTSVAPKVGIRPVDKRLHKGNRDILRRGEGTMSESSEQASQSRVTTSPSCAISSTERSMNQKSRESESMFSEHDSIADGFNSEQADLMSTMGERHMLQKQREHISRNHRHISSSLNLEGHEMSACKNQKELIDEESLIREGIITSTQAIPLTCTHGKTSTRRSSRVKSASHSQVAKSHRTPKISREEMCSGLEGNSHNIDESKNARRKDAVPPQTGNGVANMGIMRMFGLVKSSKVDRHQSIESRADKHKKLKMLFPYEEFVKLFEYEDFTLLPRGIINCGNSCYANAVLQCLTFTKPLTIYLLRRSHSRTYCRRDWCLMCELEQHVMLLRESGGPLSPSRILLHMRSINGQIGNGSQEDAHEFLRLLVASMQSICLEALGGENAVDPRLQETTFIQHTFGGRLRSKVKCLRCHHESECYENIMDLSLEIFGWVESLEDALTQFTSPEDLDGENMYRCGRCACYVRAQKQLSIQEAPNILTIVLKRFQEGSYGKINKCITFPDMLDMIPFMTATDDIPPLYMLYAVVVHLDTLNASFSGHYISYVKDLHRQGNWFRIDDTEVQPVSMSQVMSEGAYILFYKRSYPRPARRISRRQAPGILKHCPPKSTKTSRPEQIKAEHHFVGVDPYTNHRPELNGNIIDCTSGGIVRNANRNRPPVVGTYTESMTAEFSDATSSDWSLFTSSDEASFTTESTRDSFSTVDYADASATDPFSSIINSLCASDRSSNRTVACSMFSSSKPHTRFFSERKGSVLDSSVAAGRLDRVHGARVPRQVFVPPSEGFHSDSSTGVNVKYGSEPRFGPHQTYFPSNV